MQRPEKMSIKNEDLKAFIRGRDVNIINNEIVDINIAPTFVHLKNKTGVKPELHFAAKMIGKEVYENFNHLTYSIGKIIRLLEMINEDLKYLIRLYLSKNKLEELQDRNSKCKSIKNYNFDKDLTFMELKQVFSCIIKTDKKLHLIAELDDGRKRNLFTSELYNYIYDRDCYVHGALYFYYPNFIPILKVKPPGEEEHFISLNENIIRDNFKTYLRIDNVLDLISKSLNDNTY